VVLVAVLGLLGAAALAVPLAAGPWGLLAWLLALPLLGLVALMAAGVGRGFARDHWAVRLRPGGVALSLRSYLNGDLPAGEPTVCWIPAAEIRCVRRGRTERLLPGDRSLQQSVEHHLDLHLAHADTAALAEALARERDAPRRGRTHHHVYPVRLAAPDVVRVTWRSPHLALRPGLDAALAYLGRHLCVEAPEETAVDWRELDDAGVAELARDLARTGSRIDAIRLLRERTGLGLKEAVELVDQASA
jgi:hypothetical protein